MNTSNTSLEYIKESCCQVALGGVSAKHSWQTLVSFVDAGEQL